MSFTVSLQPKALEQIEDAYNWYEDQKIGLGDDFFKAIESAIKKIEQTPRFYYNESTVYRRAVIKRFSYKLIYEIENDKVFIVALKHFSRDLDY